MMARSAPPAMSADVKKVIFASSFGTVFEWYDFYLYGALAPVIARQFFSALDDGSAFVFALLAFAAGFVVRPLGALIFGRLGDLIGRKYTFLVTILLMGMSTFAVGLLPGYATIGVAAPVILIVLRMLQGLALGGEYGGAATYVAEHAPHHQRGLYTAWIQTTATLGLFFSLVFILVTRAALGSAFADWGWRIPFLLSIALLAVSIYIRWSMNESPAFRRMKAQGRSSRAPLAESFARWRNMRVVILALFGLTAGQAVVWYTGHFYALFFLTHVLKVSEVAASVMLAVALLLGTPFFFVFGALSDRVGRKPIIMAGCLLAALTLLPAFRLLTQLANPALDQAQQRNAVVVVADRAECSFQFNPAEVVKFTSSCDIAKQMLAEASVSYTTQDAAAGSAAQIRIGERVVQGYGARGLTVDETRRQDALMHRALADALRAAGFPERADMREVRTLPVVGVLFYLVVLVAMVYGPIAAALVELFPTRIRYSSVSLPYHIGNGWFGGLLPTTAFAIVAQTGNMYSGLWYPVAVAALTFVVGMLFLPETRDIDIYAND